MLVPDEATNPAGLALLPPQVPAWWLTSQTVAVAVPAAPAVPAERGSAAGKPRNGGRARPTGTETGPALFDLEPASAAPISPPATTPTAVASLGRAVAKSAVYKRQRKVAGRLIVTDDQVARLVDALAAAGATRLPPTLAAQALGVAQTRLRGALTQVQQLLNVEGYAVLAVEAATGVVILDAGLLREQFEVRS